MIVTTLSILSPFRLQQPPPFHFPIKHPFQRNPFTPLSPSPLTRIIITPQHQSHTTNRAPYRITPISPISLYTLPSHTSITPHLSHHAITNNPTSTQFYKPSSNSYPISLSTIRSRGQPFIPFQYSRIVTICHHEWRSECVCDCVKQYDANCVVAYCGCVFVCVVSWWWCIVCEWKVTVC